MHEARPCKPCRKRAASAKLAPIQAAYMSSGASARTAALASNLSCDSRPSNVDSTSSLAAVIIDCLDFLQHGGRARPHLVGRCRPRTRSTAYKLLDLSSHKLRGPRCLSSRNRTNRQFLARSSPLQAVSPEKDSAGQSFVARGPPACFSQLVVQSSPLQAAPQDSAGQSCVAHGASARTSTNGQFFARSSPLQAVSQEKDSAGQSFVARGPPACFAQPRAASAKLAPIQAAYMSSCASARTSCVARGRKRLRRAKLRGPRATCMLRPAPGRLS